jgi:hypothetical protein
LIRHDIPFANPEIELPELGRTAVEWLRRRRGRLWRGLECGGHYDSEQHDLLSPAATPGRYQNRAAR